MIKRYKINDADWEGLKAVCPESEICFYDDIKDSLIEWHKVEDGPSEGGLYLVHYNNPMAHHLLEVWHLEVYDDFAGKMQWNIPLDYLALMDGWIYLPKPPKE